MVIWAHAQDVGHDVGSVVRIAERLDVMGLGVMRPILECYGVTAYLAFVVVKLFDAASQCCVAKYPVCGGSDAAGWSVGNVSRRRGFWRCVLLFFVPIVVRESIVNGLEALASRSKGVTVKELFPFWSQDQRLNAQVKTLAFVKLCKSYWEFSGKN